MERVEDLMDNLSVYSQSEVDDNDNGWDDWQAENEDLYSNMKCLFCEESYDSAGELFHHCRQIHHFDFLAIRTRLRLDFYQCIRLLNYLRKKQLEGENLSEGGSLTFNGQEHLFKDDSLLQPSMDDDTLLFEFEDVFENASSQFSSISKSSERMSMVDGETLLFKVKQLTQQLKSSESKNLELENQFNQYKQMVKSQFYDPLIGQSESEKKPLNLDGQVEVPGAVDRDYFDGYGHNDIHEQMIKDSVRTNAYRDFILSNKDFFKGKIVMDVGCGTGILSMFAAQAGAKQVIAVDNSNIIERAKINVKDNGLDHIITFVKGKVEEITIPVPEVDIIISEWMGYFLLFEAMLDSVLVAKNRFLNKEHGILCPNYCQIMLAGFMDQELIDEKTTFWDDVYGFKMPIMKGNPYQDAWIDTLDPSSLISTTISIKDLPLMDLTIGQLDFQSDFQLQIIKPSTLNGFVGYFDTLFTTGQESQVNFKNALERGLSPMLPHNDITIPDYDFIKEELIQNGQGNPIAFTTGPQGIPSTHWKQSLFVLENPIKVLNGDKVNGNIKVYKHPDNPRALMVIIQAEVLDSEHQFKQKIHQTFNLA